MEYLMMFKNIYLYWIYISIFLYVIILLLWIFVILSQKHRNLKKLWYSYNVFFYTYDLSKHENIWEYIWALIVILFKFLLSWILVIDFILYIYQAMFWSKPDKIKEINYKLYNLSLNKKQVEWLEEEFSSFIWKDTKLYMI